MSRLRLHLTKQEAWKAVARLTLAEPVAQRHQSQTRPAFLRARCKSERLTLLDRLAVFLLPDAVAFTLATGRIVAHSENGPCGLAPVKLSCREIPFPPMSFRQNPAISVFRLRSSRPRGKVQLATDIAHYEDLND
jgi:hypothetical protein